MYSLMFPIIGRVLFSENYIKEPPGEVIHVFNE